MVEDTAMRLYLVVNLLMKVQCDVILLVMVLRRGVRYLTVTGLRLRRRIELLCNLTTFVRASKGFDMSGPRP